MCIKRMNFESLVIELTKQCNLKCKFCYAILPCKNYQNELDTQKICMFLEKFKISGGRKVLFTGGEIFLRPDLREIILFSKSVGLFVDIFTNGTLIKENDVRFLADHINLVNISLDGPMRFHDNVRGVPGSYNRTLKTIALFSKYNIKFLIQSMITPSNIHQIDWLIKIIKKYNPSAVKLGHVSKVGRGLDSENYILSNEQLLELKDLAGKICEYSNDFHTRVITNIITQHEFEIFYPSLSQVTVPWVLPDGKIISCYTHDYIDYWQLATIEEFPNICKEKLIKRDYLIHNVQKEAKELMNFELLELVSDVASRIAKNNI